MMNRDVVHAKRVFMQRNGGAISVDEQIARADKWRATVPWTVEQIAAAYDTMADRSKSEHERRSLRDNASWMRSEHTFTRRQLSWALPVLITSCKTCGKPAHYRIGFDGWCRRHRADADVVRRTINVAVYEPRHAHFGEQETEKVKRDRFLAFLARNRKTRHGG